MSVGVFVFKIHDKFLAIHFYYITATCTTVVGGCKSGTVLLCACTWMIVYLYIVLGASKRYSEPGPSWGTCARFVDQFSFSATTKGSPGVPKQKLLVLPMGHHLSRPNICILSIPSQSFPLYYMLPLKSLLLDQLQINNSDSCESWHAFTFICQYLTYLKNVNYRYCVLGKYPSTSLVCLRCFWS